MNKGELIARVAEDMGGGRNLAAKAVEAVIDAIKEALEKGEDVKLVGFGTFRVVETKPRKGRNPRTGEVVEIPSKKRVRFQQSKTWNFS